MRTVVIITTRRQIIRLASRHGREAVQEFANENPGEAVPAVGWDEPAISAGVARLVGVPERWAPLYYRAYESAARRLVERRHVAQSEAAS